MAKKRYTEPREQINTWINSELLRRFDELPGESRTEKLHLAMGLLLGPESAANVDALKIYKLDLADRYCELHQIAVIKDEVISTAGKVIHPQVQMHHIDTLELFQNEN